MKNPRSSIERFCAQHPNFGIPNLIKYVTIANVVFWIIGAVNPTLLSYLAFNPAYILHGQIWRLVTFALYPPSTGILAFLVFYFYYLIGSTLERCWGTPQFNIYFFSGVILTVIYGFAVYFITGRSFNLSMFFSIAVLFPNMQVLLFYIIPVKIKYLAYIDAALFVYGVFTTRFPANLLPVVATINFFIFCGGDLLSALPKRPSSNTVNFRRASSASSRLISIRISAPSAAARMLTIPSLSSAIAPSVRGITASVRIISITTYTSRSELCAAHKELQQHPVWGAA